MLKAKLSTVLLAPGNVACIWSLSAAAVHIKGQVRAASSPVANSIVTLWSTVAAEPRQLAQANTGDDGRFQLDSKESPGSEATLYVITRGGEAGISKGSGENPDAVMLAVLGNSPRQTSSSSR
jgi:hypothetical protein